MTRCRLKRSVDNWLNEFFIFQEIPEMQRLATTVAIAAWIGFLGVFSVELAVHAAAPDLLAAASWPPALAAQFVRVAGLLAGLDPAVAGLVAIACLAVVALFLRSLVLIHRSRDPAPARGEVLAAAGLVGISMLAAAAQATALPLLPIDLEGGFVWLAVALSVAAVAFDRLVAVETSEESREDEEFQAGVSVLARRMGQQARLYTMTEAGPSEAFWPGAPRPDFHGTKDKRP